MEKIRRESQTMLQKIFERQDRKNTGFINCSKMPMMLASLNGDLAFSESFDTELKDKMSCYDPHGTGQLDFEAFTKICMHFLLKQKRRDSQVFGGVNEVTLNVFDGP